MILALLATTLATWIAAIKLESWQGQSKARLLLTGFVGSMVIYLCYFKLLGLLGYSLLVPLGVSYYTFRLLSYLVDVYWGKIKPERNFVYFASYVAFFPHLVAGPIQRGDDYLSQINNVAWPRQQVFLGLFRLMLGLFKKMVVADQLFVITGYGFDHPGVSLASSLLSFYLFPVQLFIDFSALTDIAIGIGLLFGIRSPENFNAPFLAKNISDYWRRWHMSLTGWLRDYVFMPVRMLLREWGNVGLALTLIINMMLIALWHGFKFSFIIFGLINSLCLVADALTLNYRKRLYKQRKHLAAIAAVLGTVFTYHQVALADLFFRVAEFSDGIDLLVGLGSGWSDLVSSLVELPFRYNAWISILLAGVAMVADWLFLHRLTPFIERAAPQYRPILVTYSVILSVFVFMLLVSSHREVVPFLYENF